MGQARGTQNNRIGAQTNGQSVPDPHAPWVETEGSCPDCGHPNAIHEGSAEDEFVASHGGVGYAICLEVDPSGETADPCGCRTVIGNSLMAHERNSPSERTPG